MACLIGKQALDVSGLYQRKKEERQAWAERKSEEVVKEVEKISVRERQLHIRFQTEYKFSKFIFN